MVGENTTRTKARLSFQLRRSLMMNIGQKKKVMKMSEIEVIRLKQRPQ